MLSPGELVGRYLDPAIDWLMLDRDHIALALSIVAGFLGCAFLCWISYGRHASAGRKRFLAFVFPRAIYRHPSTGIDLQLFLAAGLVTQVLRVPRNALLSLVVSGCTFLLSLAFGRWNPDFSPTGPALLAFTLVLALVTDFSTYVVHRLHHAVPTLWAFHKVHHSAEVLTPLTAFRKHPVYQFLSAGTDVILIGPFQGLVFFLFAGPVEPAAIFGINVVFGLFYMLGGALRHSHLWLSYGPILNRMLISPAQHQIHHSRAPEHFDRNFGEVFALWDWLLGTLYLPREREELRFGVGEGERNRVHATLRQALLDPFVEARSCLRRQEPTGR